MLLQQGHKEVKAMPTEDQKRDLARFNRVAVDREMVMIGLKRQVNALSRELGRAPLFVLDFAGAPDEGKSQ
jgi:hypothetical protein